MLQDFMQNVVLKWLKHLLCTAGLVGDACNHLILMNLHNLKVVSAIWCFLSGMIWEIIRIIGITCSASPSFQQHQINLEMVYGWYYSQVVKLHVQINIQHKIWIWCYPKIKKPTTHHHPPPTTINFCWWKWVLDNILRHFYFSV